MCEFAQALVPSVCCRWPVPLCDVVHIPFKPNLASALQLLVGMILPGYSTHFQVFHHLFTPLMSSLRTKRSSGVSLLLIVTYYHVTWTAPSGSAGVYTGVFANVNMARCTLVLFITLLLCK